MNSISSAPKIITEESKVILFDGKCKLCDFWVRFIIRNDPDKIFKLASVQSEQGQEILSYFKMNTEHFDSMLYVERLKPYTKSDAAIKIAAQLSWPWKLLRFIKIIPLTIRNYLYDKIAINRYRLFGQYDQCMLPSTDIVDRFLDSHDK